VITIAYSVSTGWARASQRNRLRLTSSAAAPMIAAHAKCTDGMAESWSAIPVFIGPYTDCPYWTAVSTSPWSTRNRGGATGTNCTIRHAAVTKTTVVRQRA
jgi:hypothetical protein